MKKHYYLLMLLCLVSFIPPAYATEEMPPTINGNANATQVSTVSKMAIHGRDYISSDKHEYRLENLPSATTHVEWRASDKIILESPTDYSVLAYSTEYAKDRWIEAEVTVANADKFTIRKQLNSTPLESLSAEVVLRWRDTEEQVDKYIVKVNYEPATIPMEDLDFCWDAHIEVINNNGGLRPPILGLGCITTPGNRGMCPGDLTVKPSSTNLNNPLNTSSEIEPFIPALTGPNMALITLPKISYTQEVVGTVYCTVSDLFDNRQKIGIPVYSKWQEIDYYTATPNPANDKIVIRPESDASNNMERSAAMPKAVRAELYSDQILVKAVSFEEAATMCEINVADLANGNYYLLIYENDAVVDRQIVVIKH